MKRFLLFTVFLLSCFITAAQVSKTDSLKNVLRDAKEDTNKVKVLSALCRELRTVPKEALQYGNEAVKLSKELGYDRGLATAYHNIGIVYYGQGDYANALENYFSSLKIREKLGDKSSMSKAYNNIGLIYYQQGKQELALDYYTRSLEIKRELKDELGVAYTLGNIGNVYMAMYNEKMQEADLDRALRYHTDALKVQEKLDDKTGMAGSYNNIGNIYLEKENFELALHHQLKALVLQKELSDRTGIAHSYINTGGVYEKMGKFDNAIRYYQDALLLAQEIEDKLSMQVAYEGLSVCYEKKGETIKALEYFKLSSSIKDSVLNIESSQQMAEMQAKFDSESKQKEIEILKRESEIQHLQQKEKDHRESLVRYSAIAGVVILLIMSILLFNRYKLKQVANARLEAAYHQIEYKNKEITDSIRYAKRIQEAILPPADLVRKIFPECFILYKPKDIVSGDFYWLERWGSQALVAAVDCTGHGVPGALMSVVGYNLLNQAVNEHGLSKPGLILNALNKGISYTLRQKMEDSSVKDGMDISLISIDMKKMHLEFAGAYNSLYLVRDKQLTEIKGDKFPVGIFMGEELKRFTNHEMPVQQGDSIYIFTDGYADQFGGPNGKKFKVRQLQELLLSIQDKPMEEQGAILNTTLEQWRGNLDQVDDILVIGIRV
jgi:serine phosphatase RsbU (regulator of sigma subunit)/Tfp pilus assembly protein PilF